MLLCLILWGGVSSAWAQAYTLSFTKLNSGDNYNSYTAAHNITCDEKGWSVVGNQSVGDNLRVGGKTTTPTDRTLTSTAALVNSPICSVSINHDGTGNGKNSEITVNSITVEGSTSSNFANSKTKTIATPSVSSAGKLTFSLDEGNWDADSYFKITVNYTVAITSGSTANNCYLTINSVEFNAASEYEIVAGANNETYGTVTVDGTTITATPNAGYRVSKTEPYTVLDGTATVTDNHDGTFTVDASEDCLIKINFEAIPLHIYNFYVNGASVIEDVTYEDSDIPFPSDPSDINGKVFRGWAEATISGTTNSAPTFVSSKTMGEDDIDFYAVFATKNGSSVEYSFTLDPEDFSGTSYAANDGTHSVEASATDASGATMTVNYTTANVMKQSGKIQFKSSGSYLYNTTDLGSIVSVSTGTAANLSTTYGTSENPSSGSLSTGQGYFKIKASGGTGTSDGITVTFVKSNISYSDYCTTVSTSADITITDAGYSTLYLDYAVTIPTGVQAFTGVLEGNKLTMTELSSTIPAKTAVVLKAAEASYTFEATTCAPFSGSNDLKGCLTDTDPNDIGGGKVCTLAKVDDVVGFYWFKGSTLGANKAYLVVPENLARVTMSFEDEESAIETVEVEYPSNDMFDLMGRRTNNKTGLRIVNGKKVMLME